MSRLLDELKLPEALRRLNAKQLEQLASETRQVILEVTSKTGGHVASSLGAVDIAVALHAAFESPVDKIVWDVGHQAYAHKILTGRKDAFPTLRRYRGISGFPNIEESPHDQFTVGHASTSISQALGLAHARDILGEKHSVVAVIGDGSLSGGLAFEGMNNASSLKSNMIVILNDNEMSISRNVGAISNYLTAVRTSDFYVDIRDRMENLVKKLPAGASLFESARKLKDRTRHIVMSFKVDVMFEEMGFKYFGPIDGHNIPLIMSTLHHAREIKGPVIIHMLTKKGKGYPPAEADPTRFHGTGPFEIASGRPLNGGKKPLTYTQVFGRTMVKLAEKDEKIAAVTAAMIDGTGLEEFARKFPKRFFDVGIAEEHAITFCGAMARGGMKPVAAIYSTFLQRAYDGIMHDVALQDAGVVFAVDRAGIVGEDGATHNGSFDIAYLRSVPGMIIMAPKDENEFQHMLFTAFGIKGPVAVRYPRGEGYNLRLDDEFKKLEIAKGELVLEAKDPAVLMVAAGSMVYPSVEAARRLKNASVINARFIKPVDADLILRQAEKASCVVTVEEGVADNGFGSAVCSLLKEARLDKPVLRLGLPDRFIEHGGRETMLELFGLTAEGIHDSILKFSETL